MIKSMTGFGKAVVEHGNKRFIAEIRTLNSKQLDLNIRIPSSFKGNELELRSGMKQQIERGKADLSVFVEATETAAVPTINKALAKTYYEELKTLSAELQETTDDYLSLVLRMPDVMKAEREEPDEEEWEALQEAVNQAAAELNQFREREGNVLKEDLEARIKNIQEGLKNVEGVDPQRIENIKNRIHKNIAEFIDSEKIDQNRFEQELIYYIEKIDITEEKVRLRTHCDYFLQTLQEASSGRKLGFISQEMGREINTIGSKANDAAIQKIVVGMKDELEKVKEQLLNIL